MTGRDSLAVAALALQRIAEASVADLPGAPVVALASPWRAPELGVSLHLFEVAPLQRPAPVPAGPAAAPAEAAGPAASWRLRFLASAFAQDDLMCHRLAGSLTAAVLGTPVVGGTTLADVAGRAGLSPGGLDTRRATFRLDPVTIEEMTSLWKRFAPMRYTLSLVIACDFV